MNRLWSEGQHDPVAQGRPGRAGGVLDEIRRQEGHPVEAGDRGGRGDPVRLAVALGQYARDGQHRHGEKKQ